MLFFVRIGRNLRPAELVAALFLIATPMVDAADIELLAPPPGELFDMSATARTQAGGSSSGWTDLGWSYGQPAQALSQSDQGTSAGVAISQVNHAITQQTTAGRLWFELEVGFALNAHAIGRAVRNEDGDVIGSIPASLAIDAKLGTQPGIATWSPSSASFLHGVSQDGATMRLVAGTGSALLPGQPIWVRPILAGFQGDGLATHTTGDGSLGLIQDLRPDCQYPDRLTMSTKYGYGSSEWNAERLYLDYTQHFDSQTLLQLGDRQQPGVYRDTIKVGQLIALTVEGTSHSEDEAVFVQADVKVRQQLEVVAALPTYRQVIGQNTPGPRVQEFAQPEDGDGGLWTTVAAMVADYWQQTQGRPATANTPDAINPLRAHLDDHGVANPLGLNLMLNRYFMDHVSSDIVAREIPAWMSFDWDFADGPIIGVFDHGVTNQFALVVDGISHYVGGVGSHLTFLSLKHPAGNRFDPANLRTPADDVPYTGWTDEQGVKWVPEESLEPTSIILTGSARLLGRTIISVPTGGTIEDDGLFRLSPEDPEQLGNGLGEETHGLPDTVKIDPNVIDTQVRQKQEQMRQEGKSQAEIALAFVTLKFYYDPQTLAVWGIEDEAELRPFWWNTDENKWYLGGTTIFGQMGSSLDAGADLYIDHIGFCGVNTEENYVWVNANHASEYGLITTTIPEPTSAGLLLMALSAACWPRRRG